MGPKVLASETVHPGPKEDVAEGTVWFACRASFVPPGGLSISGPSALGLIHTGRLEGSLGDN